MAKEVERVKDPAAPDPVPETTKNKRAKDSKRVAAGHAVVTMVLHQPGPQLKLPN